MNQMIRINGVVDKTGLSRATIYKLMASGQFPATVRLAARCTAWVEAEVDQWLADKIANCRTIAA